MATGTLEERVSAMKQELALLKQQMYTDTALPWWE